ncbi:MAG: PDDEXK nuclease domain-containing protein [Candidatus Algichlamydia australiensis]|nr:PDDEXK nuclease domain-containing protein [Chlamydiales bacterium]
MSEATVIGSGYKQLLQEIKQKVRSSQIKAALSVNRELIQLYWEIGSALSQKQKEEGWGAKALEKLSKDLKSAFPDMKGFSRTNLFRMSAFYRAYEIVPQAVGLFQKHIIFSIPWGHNILLIEKINSHEERIWYIKKTIENGWSRNVLLHWITSNLYERQGKTISNFKDTLPPLQSDLAQATLKDPYNFDFLTLREKFDEKELEGGLLDHIQKFLVELGHGFAFMGRQYPITVADDTYHLDLLFYHTKLHCYVVVELKAGSFDPRDAGQMNFYLSAVDDLLRSPPDQPSIGLLLCKDKKGVKVEYALRDVKKPIGVAEYETQIMESLPENLKDSLPTIEEIENELK